jgi:hypothetical protein
MERKALDGGGAQRPALAGPLRVAKSLVRSYGRWSSTLA